MKSTAAPSARGRARSRAIGPDPVGFLRRSSNTVKPDYTGLQIQTAVSTLPIPIVWGRNKLAGNVLWYQRFVAVPSYAGGKGSGGKGGLGGHGSPTGYTYQADLIIGLCEGPISNIPTVWQDLSVYYTPLALDMLTYNGTTPQSVWPWLGLYPGQDLAYQGTAFVCAASFNLGSAASIGNLNFEIVGPLAGTGANGIDADPALVIYDFLTNAQYGAGFNPASIDATSLFGSGGDGSLQTYCRTMGLAFSPVLSSQEQGSGILTRWLQLISCTAVWSGGLLKFIPYGDSAIAQGAETTLTQQFSIPRPVAAATGYTIPSPVTVSGAASFAADGGVVYASTGIPFAFVGADVFPDVAGTYGMSPAGTYIFAPQDEGVPVIITYTVAAPTAFAPNLTPVYALTDADFVDLKGNKDPVQVERADVFSLPTIQRVEVSSRSNRYSPVPVEARDQASIEIYGPRVGSVIQGHEICDEFTMGPTIAQTLLQRELYVRTKFTFTLSAEYCLLDPMDVVTITDANLGLSNYPVRLISIEEDDKGLLAITAEELVFGVSTPGTNPGAGAGNFSQDWAVPAVPVNAPLIFQPPTAGTGGVAQVWVGASGVNAGGSNQWGGANVYVSVDNVTYSQIAVLTSPLRQGFLTASLPIATGWDAADTLAVNLAESGGTLSGTSQASAEQGATLSLVDGELLAYENATLTSGNAYNLTGLARGLSGSSPATHSTGAPFARLDGAIVKYNLPPNLTGQTLYLKFQSFNVFGGGLEDLSACAVYSFTPAATNAHPIAAQLMSGFALDLGQVTAAPTLADDFGQVVGDAVSGSVDLGAVAPVAHPIMAAIETGANQDLGSITSAVTLSDDFGSPLDAVVDAYSLGSVP